jgi:hypothetical protein
VVVVALSVRARAANLPTGYHGQSCALPDGKQNGQTGQRAIENFESRLTICRSLTLLSYFLNVGTVEVKEEKKMRYVLGLRYGAVPRGRCRVFDRLGPPRGPRGSHELLTAIFSAPICGRLLFLRMPFSFHHGPISVRVS